MQSHTGRICRLCRMRWKSVLCKSSSRPMPCVCLGCFGMDILSESRARFHPAKSLSSRGKATAFGLLRGSTVWSRTLATLSERVTDCRSSQSCFHTVPCLLCGAAVLRPQPCALLTRHVLPPPVVALPPNSRLLPAAEVVVLQKYGAHSGLMEWLLWADSWHFLSISIQEKVC